MILKASSIAVLMSMSLALGACGGGGGSASSNAPVPNVETRLNTNLGTGSVAAPISGIGVPQPDISIDPVPDSVDCSLDRCFDVAATRIAPFLGGKTAAVSYTFDGQLPSSAAIASIFERFGQRASFYISPGKVAEEAWTKWQSLAIAGHEIGNHSMTHSKDLGDPVLTDQQLDLEINGARQAIASRIGNPLMTFAFPWRSHNTRAYAMAAEKHVAIHSSDHGNSPYKLVLLGLQHGSGEAQALANINAQLRGVVQAGGWLVAASDAANPVSPQFLEAHLAHTGTHSSTLWVDTFLNVARYRQCRTAAEPEIRMASAKYAIVRLTGRLDPVLCAAALTVAIPMLQRPQGELHAATAAGTPVPITFSGNTLLLDLSPGDEVHLEIIKKTK